MYIHIASDLHLEKINGDYSFHDFIEFQNDKDVVLVLAGDIHSLYLLDDYISFVKECEKYFSNVIIVFGNHEYYWEPRFGKKKSFDVLSQEGISQLTTKKTSILFNSSVVIDDISFFGGSMWTDLPVGVDIDKIPIHNFSSETFSDKHREFKDKAKKFIENTPGEKVIVTHYCPLFEERTRNKSHPKSFMTPIWYSDCESLLIQDKVTWICGHTHSNFDFFNSQGSRLIGNQDPRTLGSSYSKKKIINV
jgi:UDP-2,3-diacylglucosamine pyrophosphatase LpxH